jgi:hypothetical protein
MSVLISEMNQSAAIPFLFFPKKFEFVLFLTKLAGYKYENDKARVVENVSIKFLRRLDNVHSLGKFIKELNEGARLLKGGDYQQQTYLLCLEFETQKKPHEKRHQWMLASFFAESDVGFGICVSNFLNNFYNLCDSENDNQDSDELIDSFQFILCGTCGGSITDKVGDSFYVTKATKFDRGVMKGMRVKAEEVLFKISLDRQMCEDAKCSHDFYSGLLQNTAHALSSNYLFHSDASELFNNLGIESDCHHVVAEMETFEFFTICANFAMAHFGAIRIVSDSYGADPEYEQILVQCNALVDDVHFTTGMVSRIPSETEISADPTMTRNLHKLGRKTLDFSPLIANLLRLLDNQAASLPVDDVSPDGDDDEDDDDDDNSDSGPVSRKKHSSGKSSSSGTRVSKKRKASGGNFPSGSRGILRKISSEKKHSSGKSWSSRTRVSKKRKGSGGNFPSGSRGILSKISSKNPDKVIGRMIRTLHSESVLQEYEVEDSRKEMEELFQVMKKGLGDLFKSLF